MDFAAGFALSLVGGYFFACWWRLTAYSTRRAEGHHLYFRAALCGAIFFVVALWLRWVLRDKLPAYAHLDSALLRYLGPAIKEEAGGAPVTEIRRAEWLLTAGYSLVLAPFCALLLNVFTPRRWAQKRSLGALDRLLLRAQKEDMPVQLSLDTDKVYIGLVTEITDTDHGDFRVMKLIPMFSGHRDAEGRMKLTTDYELVYKGLRDGRAKHLGLPADWLSQFEVAIRVDNVVSATLFSPAVYAEFRPDWRKEMASGERPVQPQELRIEIRRAAKPGEDRSAAGPSR